MYLIKYDEVSLSANISPAFIPSLYYHYQNDISQTFVSWRKCCCGQNLANIYYTSHTYGSLSSYAWTIFLNFNMNAFQGYLHLIELVKSPNCAGPERICFYTIGQLFGVISYSVGFKCIRLHKRRWPNWFILSVGEK